MKTYTRGLNFVLTLFKLSHVLPIHINLFILITHESESGKHVHQWYPSIPGSERPMGHDQVSMLIEVVSSFRGGFILHSILHQENLKLSSSIRILIISEWPFSLAISLEVSPHDYPTTVWYSVVRVQRLSSIEEYADGYLHYQLPPGLLRY